jgi:hypothetical protein
MSHMEVETRSEDTDGTARGTVEPKGDWAAGVSWLVEQICENLIGTEKKNVKYLGALLPQTSFFDFADVPTRLVAFVVAFQLAAFVALFVLFFVLNYQGQLNSTFISLDKNAGICPIIKGSTCCEVPQVVTG